MTDSTEHAEAHRLLSEALGGDWEYERGVLDLVLGASAAFAASDAEVAATMLNQHVNQAKDPDLAAYRVCVVAAMATGHLLDGDMVRRVAGNDEDRLLDLAVQAINSASVEDIMTMTLILDVVFSVSGEDVHRLAAALIALRAEVVALDEAEGDDDE